ncbi:MAG: electron transfer flavoprotein subunit alpha/FixB family protein [Candidatus Izimaplasma sp.]|nr:electron transfer flavoprotein subunit alpha/FixB family protein [Candidatus Izimaplasma bacterium]
MGYIKINQKKVTQDLADELQDICPFNAFDYVDQYLSINAACKVCKICVNKGPEGICEFIEETQVQINKKDYKGIAVYIEQKDNQAHKVGWELIGKAKELALKTEEPVYAIVIGNDVMKIAEEALNYGIDKVFVYQNKAYRNFNVENYTNVIEAFYRKYKVNIILVGGTMLGRSFAPRIAARLRTGLTADCTKLDIKENGDLLQIRPAFGGNIMAKIHTPNNRPQLATIRYKMFDAPPKIKRFGEIVEEPTDDIIIKTTIELLDTIHQPKVKDINDAEIIIAVGRAFKKQSDLDLIKPLQKRLNAEIACTRPLIENGWFDPRKQIGLSGRTVKPKLIINLGISGAVQYIEGMKESELIITVNHDSSNKLFDISHYAIHGDIYDILPELNKQLEVLEQ